MHGILVVEVNQEPNGKCEKDNEKHQIPEGLAKMMLESIEDDLKRFEKQTRELAILHDMASKLRDILLKIMKVEKESNNEKKQEPEKQETREAKKQESKKTETQETEKQEPFKYETSEEKIDDGKEETLSDSMLRRLKVLEQVVQNYSEKLGEEKITGRFKQIGELHQKFEKCLNCPDDKKESMEHLVELEAMVGDALDFLGTSKLAARSKFLKQLRVDLGEALTTSRRS